MWGRPGTGKSQTVRDALGSEDIAFHYQAGHANPLPLFNSLHEHPNGIHVLDDTTEIFKSPRGLEIVKAALATQRDGRRMITYQMGQQRMKVAFTGGMIALSNQENINPACESRIALYHFDLSDTEMDEALDQLASNRWDHDKGSLTIEECRECLYQLRAIKEEIEGDGAAIRLDLRSLTHHAYPIYLSMKLGFAKVHWIDRLRAAIHQELSGVVKCKAEQIADDREIIRRLSAASEKDEQVKAWKKLTGKSRKLSSSSEAGTRPETLRF